MGTGSSAPRERPAIVCLHGFGQQGDAWDEVAALLARRGWAVVAPDLPALMREENAPGDRAALSGAAAPTAGAGLAAAAAPATDPASSAQVAAGDSLGAVCAGVEGLVGDVFRRTGRPPVLVGYSMGGRIALETVVRACAARRALPLAGLVLESAGLGPADAAEREALRLRNEGWARRVRAEGVEEFMDWWEALPLFASQRGLPDDVRARLRAQRLRNSADALALELAGWGQQFQAAKEEGLACLAKLPAQGIPVVYCAGALDLKYCAAADEVRAAAPAAEVRVFPGAGHNIHLEDPEAFAGFLASWYENPLRRITPPCE